MSIRDSAGRTLELFDDCRRSSNEEPPLSPLSKFHSTIADLHGRFRAWCGNLGALQLGHASLDWRLRDSANMLQRTHTHLSGLIDDLEDCLALLGPQLEQLDESGYHSGLSSDSNDSASNDESMSPEMMLDEHLLSLKHTIDTLYKLAFLIRNRKSKQTAFSKAESYGRNFNGPGTDLFGQYEYYDRDRAANFVKQSRLDSGCQDHQVSQSEDNTLLNQLSLASSKRRRQFAYWANHSQMLAIQRAELLSPTTQNSDLLARARVVSGPGTVISGTEATSFHQSAEAIDQYAQSVTPSASTAKGLDGNRVPLPRPPRLTDGQTEFECPYCRVYYPAAELQRWRKHLFGDVRPYICTYVDCPSANELYGTRAEWLAHEQQVHLLVWRCRDHPVTDHKSRADFQRHMETEHLGLTPREVEASCDYSKTTLPDTRTRCPICLVNVQHLPRFQALTNHMAHHFEAFATPSFPDLEDDADDHSSGHNRDGSAGDDVSVSPDFEGLSDVSPDEFEDEPTSLDESNIHLLAAHGNKYGMRALLDSKPNVDIEDDSGCTALQRASSRGHMAISQMLLDAGADVNHPGGLLHGGALQCAVHQGHGELVQLLIDNGANVNQRSGINRSPLQAAASQGHEGIVESLLRAGADVGVRGGVHVTALETATANGYENIARLLRARVKIDVTSAPGPSEDPARLQHHGSVKPPDVSAASEPAASESEASESEGSDSAASEPAAASTQRGPQWVFDQRLKQYYYYDAARHEMVFQDGTRRQPPTLHTGPADSRRSLPASNISFEHTPKQTDPSYGIQAGPAWVFDQLSKQYFYYDAAKHELVYQNGTRRQAPDRVAARPRGAAGPSMPNMSFQYTPSQTNPAHSVMTLGPSQQSTVGLSGAMQSLTVGSAESARTSSGASGVVPTATRFDAPFDPLASATTKPLDSAYKLRGRKFFSLGRVFLTLWMEPRGLSSGKFSKNVDVDFFPVAFNEQAFCRIRRFIVINDHDLSCTALQISTHNGQGTTALRSHFEGMVFSGRTVPTLQQNEQGLQPVAIRIDLDDNSTALHHTSRINYSKVYTIEHNVKVKPFGMVNRDYIRPLMDQFRAVFLAGTGGSGSQLQQLRRPPPSADMVNNKQDPNAPDAIRPANAGKQDRLTAAQRDGIARHGPNRGGGGPPDNNRPGRPGASHMQVSNDSAAAMNPRAVLRMLGFTEPEVDAIIDRIRQRQNQREAIAFVARARAVSEGYSEDVANRIANIVVSPVYVPYHNALLQVRRAFQQANDKRVAVDANDDEEEEENNEDDNDDDEEEDDDDDDEEEDEPATMSGQGRLAQAIQLRR